MGTTVAPRCLHFFPFEIWSSRDSFHRSDPGIIALQSPYLHMFLSNTPSTSARDLISEHTCHTADGKGIGSQYNDLPRPVVETDRDRSEPQIRGAEMNVLGSRSVMPNVLIFAAVAFGGR